MDNSPMNPYLTPAAEPRTRSVVHEDAGNRALWHADDALDYGNAPEAVGAYRRAARAFLRAAELRADAAALTGGTALDRVLVDQFRADAEVAQATADRLLYGDAGTGAGGGVA